MTGIKKNFAYQSIYQITTILLPLITSPYIARVLGAENIGIYSYTYSIVYYFMLIAALGINSHGNRVIAMARIEYGNLCKTFSELIVVHSIISIIAVIAYYTYVIFVVTEHKLYFLIQGLWIISTFFDISWFYMGLEKFKFTVTRSTLVKIIMTVLTFGLVKTENDLWIYILIMAGGTCLSQMVLWLFLKRDVEFVSVTWSSIKQHIKPMIILFIPSVAVSLYRYMDKIMLGTMTTKAEVGFYENAEKAINIPVSIINSFGMVMLPKMSNMIAIGKKGEEKRYIQMSMEFVNCLACAMAFGMAGISNNFAIIFWGIEFSTSGRLMFILSITIPFMAFANVLRTQYLIPSGKNTIFVTSVCLGAVVNMVVNLFVIPVYMAAGAAVGTILAELSVCIVQAVACRKELPIIQYVKESLIFVLIGGLMYGLLVLIDMLIEPVALALCIQICIGGLFYSLISLLYFIKNRNSVVLGVLQKLERIR